MKAIYENAIDNLCAIPADQWRSAIYNVWGSPYVYKEGVLFAYATPDCSSAYKDDDGHTHYDCGCLTQVKSGNYCPVESLVPIIKADPRIPDSEMGLKALADPAERRVVLTAFGEYQELLDTVYPDRGDIAEKQWEDENTPSWSVEPDEDGADEPEDDEGYLPAEPLPGEDY